MVSKFARHVVVSLFSLALFMLFRLGYLDIKLHGLWRSVGDVGFVLLALTLVIGPLARLWKPGYKLIPWRRQLGIWFVILAFIHFVLFLNYWVKWNFIAIFGYVLEGNKYFLVNPGFGFTNLIGLVALLLALVLFATSSDSAIRSLGGKSWKWIQSFTYVIFYLVSFHMIYFFFFREKIAVSWFRIPALVLIFLVIFLQIIAFNKVVSQNKKIN